MRRFCQPGVSDLTHSGSVGLLPRTIHRGRRPLENVELLGMLAEMRHALDRRGAGADYGNALIGQLVQVAVGITPGIGIIPAAGVETVAFVAVDPRNAG